MIMAPASASQAVPDIGRRARRGPPQVSAYAPGRHLGRTRARPPGVLPSGHDRATGRARAALADASASADQRVRLAALISSSCGGTARRRGRERAPSVLMWLLVGDLAARARVVRADPLAAPAAGWSSASCWACSRSSPPRAPARRRGSSARSPRTVAGGCSPVVVPLNVVAGVVQERIGVDRGPAAAVGLDRLRPARRRHPRRHRLRDELAAPARRLLPRPRPHRRARAGRPGRPGAGRRAHPDRARDARRARAPDLARGDARRAR